MVHTFNGVHFKMTIHLCCVDGSFLGVQKSLQHREGLQIAACVVPVIDETNSIEPFSPDVDGTASA